MECVDKGTSVLDLGCGDGELLHLLVRERSVQAQGIEINEQAVYQCVTRGVSVFHEDIDDGLADYADRSFDYVILHRSFQRVKNPRIVLREALRVGEQVIVEFVNFAQYPARFQLFFKGETAVISSLPCEWHDTPNLHFLSVSDIVESCQKRSIKIEKSSFTRYSELLRPDRDIPHFRSAKHRELSM
jgi:methionine biosynthesis protein MetW